MIVERFDEWMVGRDHQTAELRPASSATIAELMKRTNALVRSLKNARRRAATEHPGDSPFLGGHSRTLAQANAR
jgi:hypothetical protein